MARLLRDWTDSEKVNSLSIHAEVFFTRLIMKADDFGSYHANPQLLKGTLFPLRPTVRTSDISLWIAECDKNGLLVLYADAGKQYLRIANYGQRLRNYRNRFPDPPLEIIKKISRSEEPPEVEDEVEKKGEAELTPARDGLFFSLEKFEKEIKNSYSQIEAAARRNRTTTAKIISMIPDFIDTCRVKGKLNETWQEYCGYFSNWLLTEFSKQNKGKVPVDTVLTKPVQIDYEAQTKRLMALSKK